MYNEMKQAGLTHVDMFWEVAAAVSVLLTPCLLMLLSELK